jgi:hypothetical protein
LATTTLIKKGGEIMTLKSLKKCYNNLKSKRENFAGMGFVLFPFVFAIFVIFCAISVKEAGNDLRKDLLRLSEMRSTMEEIVTDINNNEFLPDNHYANVSDFSVTHNPNDDTFELIIKNEALIIDTDYTICEVMVEKYALNCESNVLVAPNATDKLLAD